MDFITILRFKCLQPNYKVYLHFFAMIFLNFTFFIGNSFNN